MAATYVHVVKELGERRVHFYGEYVVGQKVVICCIHKTEILSIVSDTGLVREKTPRDTRWPAKTIIPYVSVDGECK